MGVKRYEKIEDRPDPRTPVMVDSDVYQAIVLLAVADERSITRYVNRVLRQHAKDQGMKVGNDG